MSLWPDSIVLDGVSIPLDEVLADVTIHHGREQLLDEPTATSCQLTIRDVAPGFARAFRVGSTLAVTVRDGAGPSVPRFTGKVTDAALDVDELTVVAVGRYATLRQYIVGAVPWPAEPWSARVERIFDEAGLVPANLYPDPGMEATSVNYAPLGTGIPTIATDVKRSGAQSLRIAAPAAGDGAYFAYGAQLAANTGYKMSAWIYSPAAIQVQMSISDFVDYGAINSAYDVPAGRWTYIEAAGVTDVHSLVYPLFRGNTPGTFYVDDARLFRSSDPDALDVLELYPDPTFDPELAPRDPATAGTTTLGDYLTFLAPMVGAAVTDRMDGRILVQAIGSRTLEGAVRLSPADVAYAPVWEQLLPSANIVTVRYTGDQSESVTIRDEASIDHYDDRPRTIDTTFTSVADANRRAAEALGRGAFSRWNIPEAPLVRPLELRIGHPVELVSMPPASPFDPWTPIVEGWEDTITRDEWTMRVALYDPLESGLGLRWNDVPAGELWTTIDQAIPWRDALALDDLIGV